MRGGEGSRFVDLFPKWKVGNQTGTIRDVDYPHAFFVPIRSGETRIFFETSDIKADGAGVQSHPVPIGASPWT